MTVKCNKCKEEINKEDLEKNYYICPICGKLNRMPAKNRLQMLTEKFDVMFNDQEFTDPIDFPSYKEKYESAREKSGETEGVVCGRGTIGGQDTCIFIMEPNFMMGSMGTVVGDRITALFEYATKHRLPVIGYTVSGGARMQEGALSLMQMAKVSAAAKRHSDAGLLYVYAQQTQQWEVLQQALQCLETSFLQSQRHLSALRVLVLLSRPSDRSCLRASRGQSSSLSTALWI